MLVKLRRAERDLGLPLRGERIAIGVSGGWDSLALLRVLEHYRRVVKEKPELFAVYTAFRGPDPAAPPVQLVDHIAGRGIPFITVKPATYPPSCPLCRFKRRELLLKTAKGLGCRVVALGHHLEDFGETLLLNLLYAGTPEGMAPELCYFGTYAVIRPLLYVTKKEITALGRALAFPPPPRQCALSDDSRRMVIRSFLSDLAHGNRHVLTNLLRAGLKTLASRRST